MAKSKPIPTYTALGVIFLLLAGLGYGAYLFFNLRAEYQVIKGELSRTGEELEQARQENTRLNEELTAEQARIRNLMEQVGNISTTVGTLEKLSKTDPELLQKYSKVYFLNEHYVPTELVEIDEQYLLNPEEKEQIHARVWPKLRSLLNAASSSGITLRVLSGYRSFGTQSSLKSRYKVVYGAGTANQFSADQGYSEHQLGTTVDFTTPEIGATLAGFDETEAFEWLEENAHNYGFTLSYPENNEFYIFEPWHWRFVGVRLANDLYDQNIYFYDMNQRKIDEYLVNVFD